MKLNKKTENVHKFRIGNIGYYNLNIHEVNNNNLCCQL